MIYPRYIILSKAMKSKIGSRARARDWLRAQWAQAQMAQARWAQAWALAAGPGPGPGPGSLYMSILSR